MIPKAGMGVKLKKAKISQNIKKFFNESQKHHYYPFSKNVTLLKYHI